VYAFARLDFALRRGRILLTRSFARSYDMRARCNAGVNRGLRSDKRRNDQGGEMSFWENASGATKGVIIVGALLIVVFGGMMATGTGLYAPPAETTQERGIGNSQPAE
jgi:hypothetical protein